MDKLHAHPWSCIEWMPSPLHIIWEAELSVIFVHKWKCSHSHFVNLVEEIAFLPGRFFTLVHRQNCSGSHTGFLKKSMNSAEEQVHTGKGQQEEERQGITLRSHFSLVVNKNKTFSFPCCSWNRYFSDLSGLTTSLPLWASLLFIFVLSSVSVQILHSLQSSPQSLFCLHGDFFLILLVLVILNTCFNLLS